MRAPSSRPLTAPWRVEPVRPPLPGESADGLLARVAAAEYAIRTIDFTAMAGATFAHRAALSRQDADGVAIVADCLGVDPRDLAQRSVVEPGPRRIAFFGTSIDPLHVVGNVRRFSPAALVKSPHHRALWTLRPFPFCEEQWEYLIEKCPSCEVTQRWSRTNGVEHCDHCGEPLERAESAPVPADLRKPLRAAMGLVHPDRTRREASLAALPNDLATMDAADLLDLLCAVAGVVRPEIRLARSSRAIDPKSPAAEVADAVADAWRTLTSWPTAFDRLIGDRLATRAGRFGDGNQGATLSFLNLPERSTLPPNAANAICRVRKRLWTNSVDGYHIRDAAARAGTTVTALSAARRRGEIPTVFNLEGQRPLPLLGRAAIDAMASEARSSFASVASRLGTTFRGVELLVVAGHLEKTPAPIGRGTHGAVTRASLGALLAQLEAASAPTVEDPLPLRAAMKIIGGRLKPWAAVIAAMRDGRMAFRLTGDGATIVDRAMVSRGAMGMISRLRDEPPPGQRLHVRMSKRDAADALNLHARHLAPVLGRWPSGDGDVRVVPVSAVLDIARRHITAAEAAARLSIPPNSVRSILRGEVGRLSEAGYDRAAFEALVLTNNDGGIRTASEACEVKSLEGVAAARRRNGLQETK